MSSVVSSARGSSLLLVSLCIAAAVTVGCGSDSPSPSPAAPTPPTTSALQIRATGEASRPLEAGQAAARSWRRRLEHGFDVGDAAGGRGQSSAPAIATVSCRPRHRGSRGRGGNQRDVSERERGDGPGRAAVALRRDDLPATASFGNFGGGGSVQVLRERRGVPVERAQRRALAALLVRPWGSRQRQLRLLGSSQQLDRSSRTANIVITTSSGQTVAHAVGRSHHGVQLRDAARGSRVHWPPAARAQFNVIATPDCRWTPRERHAGARREYHVRATVEPVAGWSATVQAHTRQVGADGCLEIAGMSGAYPNGRHRIVLLKRWGHAIPSSVHLVMRDQQP